MVRAQRPDLIRLEFVQLAHDALEFLSVLRAGEASSIPSVVLSHLACDPRLWEAYRAQVNAVAQKATAPLDHVAALCDVWSRLGNVPTRPGRLNLQALHA